MEQLFGIAGVPVIATIVYWIINAIKYAVKDNDKFNKFIPLLAMSLGTIIGVILYYIEPSYIIAESVFVAMMLGGASGLSATGANQIIKQFSKVKEVGTEIVEDIESDTYIQEGKKNEDIEPDRQIQEDKKKEDVEPDTQIQEDKEEAQTDIVNEV